MIFSSPFLHPSYCLSPPSSPPGPPPLLLPVFPPVLLPFLVMVYTSPLNCSGPLCSSFPPPSPPPFPSPFVLPPGLLPSFSQCSHWSWYSLNRSDPTLLLPNLLLPPSSLTHWIKSDEEERSFGVVH